MVKIKTFYGAKSILILNRPHVITESNFYIEIFRVPEVLNRLRQYRKILSEKGMNIPVWVYCLTQDIRTLIGSPQPIVLNFLINCGLFDRWISKNGWPLYMIGSDPLMSFIAGEISFEEQVLLLSNGYGQESKKSQLYKVSSYYNDQTQSFCLTRLEQKKISLCLKGLLLNVEKQLKFKTHPADHFFQFLAPHEETFMNNLKSYGFSPREFLEGDKALKWLWPVWKKTQMKEIKKRSNFQYFI